MSQKPDWETLDLVQHQIRLRCSDTATAATEGVFQRRDAAESMLAT